MKSQGVKSQGVDEKSRSKKVKECIATKEDKLWTNQIY